MLLLLFTDEAEALFQKRNGGEKLSSGMVTTLLAQMTNFEGGIFLIAATNLPGNIDSAFVRRFNTKILVEMPNKEERKKILQNLHDKRPADCESDLLSFDFEWLAEKTEGYCSGDLGQLMKKLIKKERFRTCAQAKYFCQTDTSKNTWIPCSKHDKGAEEIQWEKLLKMTGAKIILPPLRRSNLINVLKMVKPSQTDSEMAQNVKEFASKYSDY